MPSNLPRLLVPRSGGNATSCQLDVDVDVAVVAHGCGSLMLSPRALLLLLRLSSRCLALDFLTGGASSSGSLCTSHLDGDLNLRLADVGEVTGDVNRCTKVLNIVIIVSIVDQRCIALIVDSFISLLRDAYSLNVIPQLHDVTNTRRLGKFQQSPNGKLCTSSRNLHVSRFHIDDIFNNSDCKIDERFLFSLKIL